MVIYRNGFKTFSVKFQIFYMLQSFKLIQQDFVYLYANEAWSCIAGEVIFDMLICSFAIKVHVFFQLQGCHSDSSLMS